MSTEGRHPPRSEDPALLTGAGRFVDDIAAPGALHMVLVRAPVAAGRIAALEVAEAREMPGVAAVYTGADLAAAGVGLLRSSFRFPRPDGGEMTEAPCPVLATDHVHFAGDPVAAVLAETPQQAQDAAEAVVLEIDAAPAAPTLAAALAPDAPRVRPEAPDNRAFRMERGDTAAVEQAFAGAAHVVEAELDVTRAAACPLEPRALLAVPDDRGVLLRIGSQVGHRYADAIAALVPGLSPGEIRMPRIDIGGGFGMRNSPAREAVLATWACRETGRPLRWTASRSEAMLSDFQGRDRLTRAALALDEDGRFLALRVEAFAALGGYIAPNGLVPAVMHYAGHTGVYEIPAASFAVTGVLTNTQPTVPYRGAGRPEATYTIERLIDIAARRLGLDRAELRRRNLVAPARIPHVTALGFTYDSGDFPRVLDRALAAADWQGRAARRAQAEARGRRHGTGLAMAIEGAGGPYGKPSGEFAELRLTEAGGLQLLLGTGDSGQGHATAFGALAARLTGVEFEDIAVTVNDTEAVEDGFGSMGSRSAQSAGTALHHVAAELVEKARAVAAELLQVDPGEVEHDAGTFRARASNAALGWAEIARARPGLSAKGIHAPGDATFPNGCHVCEVELDPETGAVEVTRYVVAEDIGTVLHPALAEGQMHGGIAQGAGQALMERIVHDADGQLLTGSFMDYALPRATDLPLPEVRHCPSLTPSNPLGAKGGGEAGTVGALPAVISAVCDALDIAHLDMPASPARVWQALRRR